MGDSPEVHHVQLEGIDVAFPYKPYSIQEDYMREVICCAKESQHGLLESPTGTGKTLSLLCASLAWLTEQIKEEQNELLASNSFDDESHLMSEDESNGGADLDISEDADEFVQESKGGKKKPPAIKYKVIYASRTHKQLSQVMGEFKKTVYKDLLSICLASREHYCINDKLKRNKKLPEINAACRETKKKCQYFKQKAIDQLVTGISSLRMECDEGGVIDVEDLVNIGIGRRVCPYFTSQSIASTNARVIFTPYNYLLEQLVKLDLNNSVIIFDEGHNIESACEDAASGFMSSLALLNMHAGLSEIFDGICEGTVTLSGKYAMDPDIILEMKDFCHKVYDAFNPLIANYNPKSQYRGSSSDQKTRKIEMSDFKRLLFEQLELTFGKVNSYAKTVETMFEFLKEIPFELLRGKGGRPAFAKGLETVADFFSRIFGDESQQMTPEEFSTFLTTNFRVAISELKSDPSPGRRRYNKRSGENSSSWVLNFYCMNPGVTISRLVKKGIRSIIITSGTLAPMDSFEAEMGIKFPRTLCNSHVIPESQLVIFMICKHDELTLDGSYKNESPSYFQAVGKAVERYTARIPAGVLLFFKSYSAKERCFEEWQKSGLLNHILAHKEIFHEPQDKEEFADTLTKYKKTIDHGKGGIFAAVYRGKVSEGLDLANDYCRGAIIIGLPYPFLKDPKVELKRDYLAKSKIPLTSEKWYENQMLRAVNQAVGRIVRHKDDYGIVLLMDTKYETKKSGLSQWLHKFVRDTRECKSQRFDSFFQENLNRQKCLSPHPPAIEEQLDNQYNDYEPISNGNGLQLQSSVCSPNTTTTCNASSCTATSTTCASTYTTTAVATDATPAPDADAVPPAFTAATVKQESQEEQELLSFDLDWDDERPGPSDLQPCNKKMRPEDNWPSSSARPSSSQASSQKSEYEFDDSLDSICMFENGSNGTCYVADAIEGLRENFNQAYSEAQRQDFILLNNAISVYKNGGGLDDLVHLFKQSFGRLGHEQLKRVLCNLARYIPFESEEDTRLFKVKCVGDE